jgi:hypothetical protein
MYGQWSLSSLPRKQNSTLKYKFHEQEIQNMTCRRNEEWPANTNNTVYVQMTHLNNWYLYKAWMRTLMSLWNYFLHKLLKGVTTGKDMYEKLSTTLELRKLLQNKLISVTTHGSLNLKKGRNLSLLQRMQDLHMMDVLIRKYCFFLYHSPWICDKHSCETCKFHTSGRSEP